MGPPLVFKPTDCPQNLLANGSASLCAVFSTQVITDNFEEISQSPRSRDLFFECNPLVVYHMQNKFIERQNLISGEWEKPDVSYYLPSAKEVLIPLFS